jgi:hypothetical protein
MARHPNAQELVIGTRMGRKLLQVFPFLLESVVTLRIESVDYLVDELLVFLHRLEIRRTPQ